MRALKYSVREALASLARGWRIGALSMLTIATALLVLGTVLLLAFNLERLAARWTEAAEFSVYLNDDLSPDTRSSIERTIDASPAVASREFVSRDDAARRFRRDSPELADVAESLPTNPLPASFEVRLRTDEGSGEQAEDLAARLRSTAGVEDVRYDRQWIERVLGATGLIRGVGVALAVVLSLGGALTVASVVRLALHARSDEIQIMQLVGAPLAYLRGPFVVEGLILGGAGAVLALASLWGIYAWGRGRYLAGPASLIDPAAFVFLPWGPCLLLVTGGLLVGCLGGMMAARATR